MEAVDPWAFWLALALILGIAEVFATYLVLGLIAGGAGAATLTALLGLGWVPQIIVFAAVSIALLIFVRPVARRHLYQPPRIRTGIDRLVGETAVVVEEVGGEDPGRVKLAGEIWTARSFDGRQVLRPGARVEVMEIKGATALVYSSPTDTET